MQDWFLLPLLGILGAAAGSLINWAIYSWAMFTHRPVSPWMKPAVEESARQARDYVPVLGWPGRARDQKLYGHLFWVRPMLLEAIWLVGLPCFYLWLRGGGLSFGNAPNSTLVITWFVAHGFFLALLFIATFIDFDEQTIPDEITITGTMLALMVAALAPWFRLPVQVGLKGAGSLGSLDYLSPAGEAAGASTGGQLGFAALIFAIWIWALLPKLPVWYVGWGTSIRLMYAAAFRPKRKTECALRVQQRQTPLLTKLLCVLLVAGLSGILLSWSSLGPTAWHSLYGSLLGMAFGGGMIWAIRIIGTWAMQQEAMGFGDVTLMAMIGATLGWQATLLSFVYAVVVIVVFLVVQVIATGLRPLAFGPYLCAGAAVLLFRWSETWPGASAGVFSLGAVLLYIIAGSLVLMALMLVMLQWLKRLGSP